MGKGSKPVSSQVRGNASTSDPVRIDWTGRNITSHGIVNSALSDQVLWVGVNTEEALEPLQPGQSKGIDAEEGLTLVGFITMRWDDPSIATEVRSGFNTITFRVESEAC